MRSSRESRGEKMRWIRRRKRRGEKRADMRVSGDNEDRVRLR